MEALETVYRSSRQRVSVYADESASNPLADWDHGVSFHGFDESGSRRRWAEMSASNASVVNHLDFLTIGAYREYYGDSIHWYQLPVQNAPSLRTFLDRHAVWIPLYDSDRDGLHVANDNPENWQAVAYVTLASIRSEYNVKRITKELRAMIDARIRGVMAEYRAWANGETYYLALEEHNANCPYCDPAGDPERDCRCWDVVDSAGGIIGAEYVSDAISDYFPE